MVKGVLDIRSAAGRYKLDIRTNDQIKIAKSSLSSMLGPRFKG